jgi:phage terminase large subunit-like protein
MIEFAGPDILSLVHGLTLDKIDAYVDSLSEEEAISTLSDWSLWRLPYQTPPPGKWTRWINRGGRGSGKTHTGSRTTNETAKDKAKIRNGQIGIIGRTYSEARFVMVEGPSGILATSTPDFRPEWEPGNGVLRWPNGVIGRVFSADKPESMRGPNFAWVWGDEPAHWPDLYRTWIEVIEPALRIGCMQALLTTTPIRNPDLQRLEKLPGSVVTRARTFDNPYLPIDARERLREIYEGTRAGLQELEGEYLTENEHALWTYEDIESNRVKRVDPALFQRVVVALDPAVTAHEDSDETGIIVAARGLDGHGYVIADRSLKASPLGWARAGIAAYHRFSADLTIGEVNNGGDLVETTISTVDPRVNFKAVRASRGKFTRAEPIAAMYERGMIHHVGVFPILEEQLTTWDASTTKSPDRLDALVWALHELFLQDAPTGPLRAYL